MKAKLGEGCPNDPLIVTFEEEDEPAFGVDGEGSLNILKQIILTPLQWERMKIEADNAFVAYEHNQEGITNGLLDISHVEAESKKERFNEKT
jgi:hypothetical protein